MVYGYKAEWKLFLRQLLQNKAWTKRSINLKLIFVYTIQDINEGDFASWMILFIVIYTDSHRRLSINFQNIIIYYYMFIATEIPTYCYG